MARSIETRIREHEKDVDYERTEKSAVAEHAKQKDHTINFNGVNILSKEKHYGKRMIKEAIEIEKCPKNFNREDGWRISNAWKTIIHEARKQRIEKTTNIKDKNEQNNDHPIPITQTTAGAEKEDHSAQTAKAI